MINFLVPQYCSKGMERYNMLFECKQNSGQELKNMCMSESHFIYFKSFQFDMSGLL
jgi:hypothetical protein